MYVMYIIIILVVYNDIYAMIIIVDVSMYIIRYDTDIWAYNYSYSLSIYI